MKLNNGSENISRLSVLIEGEKISSVKVNLQLCADVRPDATEGDTLSVDISDIHVNGKNIRPSLPLPGGREILLCRKCLYAPGEYGFLGWRIPALLQLSDSTLLAVNDRRNDSEENLPGCIDVVYRYSTDNGQTWSKPAI